MILSSAQYNPLQLITFMDQFPRAIPVIEDGANFHFFSVLSDKTALISILR